MSRPIDPEKLKRYAEAMRKGPWGAPDPDLSPEEAASALARRRIAAGACAKCLEFHYAGNRCPRAKNGDAK